MIATDDRHLMMIEPKDDSCVVLDDELTQNAVKAFSKAIQSVKRYRGFHTCVCGRTSDNGDWIMPDGRITNSLLVHYVAYHRGEVPQEEIDKMMEYV